MSRVADDAEDRPWWSRRGAGWHVFPAAAYLVLVFVSGSVPMSGPSGPPGTDKLLHLAAFAILHLLVFRAVRFVRPHLPFGHQLGVAALLSAGAGGLLEVWQAFLGHRSAELMDWLADLAGIGLAAAGILALGVVLGRAERP